MRSCQRTRSWRRSAVVRVHFSPDGAQILTIGADNSAKLWDAASGKLLTSFAHQDAVFQAEFSSNGAQILTASRDKSSQALGCGLRQTGRFL